MPDINFEWFLAFKVIIKLLFHFFFAELLQNLRFSILIFLVIRFSQDPDNHEIIPFVVHYQNNLKEVKIIISDFMVKVKDKIESCPGFTQQFRLQFEHQGCNIFVDLDEPVQLMDGSSNILNVIADDKADDADKIASITSGF